VKLSLRMRLTLAFSIVLGLSLAVFGGLTFTSIRNELNTNLDVSLNKVISGLDVIIRQQAEQSQLTPPQGPIVRRRSLRKSSANAHEQDELAFLTDTTRQDTSKIKPSIKPLKEELKTESKTEKPHSPEDVDAIWSAIYEQILLTPRNFMIQVLDSNGVIVWKSENLGDDSLQLPMAFISSARDSVAQFTTITQKVSWRVQESSIRVAIARSRTALIVAGYPSEDVEALLPQYFSTLLILAPAVLLLSTIGGWFLAKASLRPVDEITRTAQDITASNLSRRLPVATTKDEIGRLSATLNDMISRLESSFERIRQFTADASHELRTPLTIMTGELELALRTRKTPEEYQDVLSSALQEVLRLSHVVESLLLLSRTDMGRVSLHMERTNLGELLADLADAATILGTQKNIYITFRPGEDLYVNADSGKLRQIFLNLVDNAVKYTPAGGMISIAMHREGNWAEVRVRDTGIGIEREHVRKIFDRFYRVDKARSRELGGAGLGLSIVQWIVQIHNGTISVESEPGKGSTFIVRLPLIVDKVAEEPVVEEHRRRGIHVDVGKLLKRPKERVDPGK